MPAPEVPSRAEPRRHRRRTSTVVAVLCVLVIGAGAFALSGLMGSGGGDAHETHSAQKARNGAKTLAKPTGPNLTGAFGRAPFRAASTSGGDIPVFAAPDPGSAPVDTLSRETEYLLPRTVLAFDQWQDWLHVYLPTRPNSSTGWVKASDVTLSAPLEWQVRVSLPDHRLWLFHNGVVEFETDVAIGTAQYPTPTGTFFVTDPIDLHQTPDLGYGVFAIGLSGHSDVLTDFMGGDGQIAIHGTNNPGEIGRDVSHGCVRVTNAAIERLSTLPLGTPVEIG
jgi:lipoprotein-anchoring transpeptidase ErfK/SrfK